MTTHARIVLFDIFNTLVHLDDDEDRPGPFEALSTWLGYHGMFADGPELRVRRQALVDDAFAANDDPHPDIDMAGVYRDLLVGLPRAGGVEPERWAGEAALVFRIAATNELWAVDGVHQALEELGRRCRLAIASNTQRVYTEAELVRFDLTRHFESVVFSSDVLACKPSTAIFERSLDLLGATPSEVIYVGDNPLDDVVGAAAAGIDTVLLDWEGRFGPQPIGAVAPVATHPAARMAELPVLLAELGW